MRSRFLFKYLTLFLSIILLLSIGGVFAVWVYPEVIANPVSDLFHTQISVFEYTPEEILPGGDEIDEEIGQNHFALIDIILNEKDKSYGLNINNNALLHEYLRDDGFVYSNQKVQGGNLKFILDAKNNTHGLYYCLQRVSNTLYYCYTFSTLDLSNAAGTDTEIVAFRTNLEKTDKWYATTSVCGYAKTISLRSIGVSADSNTIEYSIDMDSWHTHDIEITNFDTEGAS